MLDQGYIRYLHSSGFRGQIAHDEAHRQMYATDASIYEERPMGVLYPMDKKDVQIAVRGANELKIPLIPRGAGTSLAGQCVGSGWVIDCYRHMNKIQSVDQDTGYTLVQPGVVRDVLNAYAADSKWYFGPNTSTSNRASIGGMVANNSSGSTSLQYGVTRDKVRRIEMVTFTGEILQIERRPLSEGPPSHPILSNLYAQLLEWSIDEKIRQEIRSRYPSPGIHRRNTGLAIDLALRRWDDGWFDPIVLFCGSEGTLGLMTEIELQLDPLPPPGSEMILVEFSSIHDALTFVPTVLGIGQVYTLELMDETILNCVRKGQQDHPGLNFIIGHPAAVLIIEWKHDDPLQCVQYAAQAKDRARKYAAENCTSVPREAQSYILHMRAAGLGVLSNIPGTHKAVACIEDTAVDPSNLADYISDFSSMMKRHGQQVVYYAHAGAGELHLRPVLDLYTSNGAEQLEAICVDAMHLVRDYNGSLSGEHGDGRVRGALLLEYFGEVIYEKHLIIKKIFDPNSIFNPHKIVDAKPLAQNLRFIPSHEPESVQIDISPDDTLLRHAERCNGSADCLKPFSLSPGMCPTYQATHEEVHSTRARANLLRQHWRQKAERLTTSDPAYDAVSSCLGCKACKSECPSGVDMALLKSAYLSKVRVPWRTRLRDALIVRPITAGLLSRWTPSKVFNHRWTKRILHIDAQSRLPIGDKQSLKQLMKSLVYTPSTSVRGKVVVMIDEFVQSFQQQHAIDSIRLLVSMGFEVYPCLYESGRAAMSKGHLARVHIKAEKTLKRLNEIDTDYSYFIGLEPSALSMILDDYSRLASQRISSMLDKMKGKVTSLAGFLVKEIEKGNIDPSSFSSDELVVGLHLHCHQKSMKDDEQVRKLVNWLEGVHPIYIHTGCCGMAGSFGYEKEHAWLSRRIAEKLFYPQIESLPSDAMLITDGMSCQHQVAQRFDHKTMTLAQFLLNRLI